MQNNWRKCYWGDLATLEYGKSLKGYAGKSDSYKVFGTNGPIGWYSEPLCNHPTIVIGRKGAYRGVHFSKEPCFVIDTAFYLSPKTEFDMRWAYYELLGKDINSMDSGSAILSTSRGDFYSLIVKVPPLEEQKAIAHILGTLDDKIEVNRRMNETLEEMARALFKSWFVDFDPVIDNAIKAGNSIPEVFAERTARRKEVLSRAKPNDKLPTIPPEISSLFPSSFQDSELGTIPEGWRVGNLGDEFNITMGQSPPGETYN
jgi:type I restriction enzyme, S subunit